MVLSLFFWYLLICLFGFEGFDELSFITKHRIPTEEVVVMNLKCYKSVILSHIIRNEPLIAIANIARAK